MIFLELSANQELEEKLLGKGIVKTKIEPNSWNWKVFVLLAMQETDKKRPSIGMISNFFGPIVE